MNYLVFDIETVPNDLAEKYFEQKTYKPDGRLKDADKIAANLAEQKQRDMDRAGLSWITGKVVCISTFNIPTSERISFCGVDERVLLDSFLNYLATKHPNAYLIGKSSKDFDIPFIIGRCLVHDLGLTSHFQQGFKPLTDINQIFGWSKDSSQVGRLADYAFALQIPGKLSHGSEVSGMYAQAILGQSDKWDKIRNYCEQDVAITTEVLRRYLKRYEPRRVEQDLNIPF